MENLDIFKQVGKKVQKIRTLRGLSQVDLVGKMEGNIDTTNISRIESGRTNPTLLTLYRLAQALEVPISELVSFDDAKVEQSKISS